jgi:hypothetical protein
LKKPTGSVQFRFYKPKIELNRTQIEKNRKKQSQTRKKPSQNRAKPKKESQIGKNKAKTEKTEPNRFEPVRFGFSFFLKKFGLIIFFLIKTEPNRK